MEFTEAESNMNDLVSEYQQYQAGPICFGCLHGSLHRVMQGVCWSLPCCSDKVKCSRAAKVLVECKKQRDSQKPKATQGFYWDNGK